MERTKPHTFPRAKDHLDISNLTLMLKGISLGFQCKFQGRLVKEQNNDLIKEE